MKSENNPLTKQEMNLVTDVVNHSLATLENEQRVGRLHLNTDEEIQSTRNLLLYLVDSMFTEEIQKRLSKK